jgi:hypothetical protein
MHNIINEKRKRGVSEGGRKRIFFMTSRNALNTSKRKGRGGCRGEREWRFL